MRNEGSFLCASLSPSFFVLLYFCCCCFSVLSDSLWPQRLQNARNSLSFIIPPSLPKLKSTESVMSSNHLIFCCPLLFPPSTFPNTRVFSSESALQIRWPKYWSFNFSISSSNEHSGLIYFRIDWFDLLAVQEILKSLFQCHILKASVLQCSAFFMVL